MIKGLSIEKIYRFLNKYYRLIIGTIFTILIIIWGLIYYQYIYLPTSSEATLMDHKLLVNEEKLQQTLVNLEDREENLSRVLKNSYPDLFTP